jgi:hypothetical protein
VLAASRICPETASSDCPLTASSLRRVNRSDLLPRAPGRLSALSPGAKKMSCGQSRCADLIPSRSPGHRRLPSLVERLLTPRSGHRRTRAEGRRDHCGGRTPRSCGRGSHRTLAGSTLGGGRCTTPPSPSDRSTCSSADRERSTFCSHSARRSWGVSPMESTSSPNPSPVNPTAARCPAQGAGERAVVLTPSLVFEQAPQGHRRGPDSCGQTGRRPPRCTSRRRSPAATPGTRPEWPPHLHPKAARDARAHQVPPSMVDASATDC